MKNYNRTARFEDNKLILTPHANEAEMFRVVVCANRNNDEWLEILRPGQTHECESYTWAVAPSIEGAREAYDDWF